MSIFIVLKNIFVISFFTLLLIHNYLIKVLIQIKILFKEVKRLIYDFIILNSRR